MRAELKYLVPKDSLETLRAQIAPFVALDRHGKGFENQGYTVRSVYFDTISLRYYHEKKSGINVRRKLRIRAYNSYQQGDRAFLEIKRKIGSKVRKNRAPVRVDDLKALFSTGDIDQYVEPRAGFREAREDARRFFFHIYRYNLHPTHLTVYEREAFVGRFDHTLRITFDRHLRGGAYPRLDDVYQETGLKQVFPDHFILEIKYNTRFPGWLQTVLGKYGLRHRSISKYCLCAEVHKKHWDDPVSVIAQSTGVLPSAPQRALSEPDDSFLTHDTLR